MIDKKILEILACPKCKGDLVYIEKGFICDNCLLLFKIEEGIPNFLIDEAESIDKDKLNFYLNQKS